MEQTDHPDESPVDPQNLERKATHSGVVYFVVTGNCNVSHSHLSLWPGRGDMSCCFSILPLPLLLLALHVGGSRQPSHQLGVVVWWWWGIFSSRGRIWLWHCSQHSSFLVLLESIYSTWILGQPLQGSRGLLRRLTEGWWARHCRS